MGGSGIPWISMLGCFAQKATKRFDSQLSQKQEETELLDYENILYHWATCDILKEENTVDYQQLRKIGSEGTKYFTSQTVRLRQEWSLIPRTAAGCLPCCLLALLSSLHMHAHLPRSEVHFGFVRLFNARQENVCSKV